MIRKCHQVKCAELHSHWSNPDVPRQQYVEPPEVWCSWVCASWDGAMDVRSGLTEKGKQIVKEVNGL